MLIDRSILPIDSLILNTNFSLELVEKVFLKIVFAETDDKFQAALNTFLVPALLKLASPNTDVRSKVGLVCFLIFLYDFQSRYL